MRSRRVLSPTIVSAVLLLATAAWAAGTSKVIYSFQGGNDGEYADTELAIDSAGNLYGATVQGGKNASGTVFQLTSAGVHTVLYDFQGGADGGEPYKGVTLDIHGNLFGTAVAGGGGSCEGGCGVVYMLTSNGGTWTQTVIHTFLGSDGSGPGAPVVFDRHGNLYGTTPTGGKFGNGVVFKMRVDSTGTWHFKVLHNFTGGVDGLGGSASRLLIDSAGNIYGVCTSGGANSAGNVYKLSVVQGKWQLTPLYSFQGGASDGASPYSGLIFDKSGNLYGTTYYAGANTQGTVYKLTPGANGWTETVLYNFKGGSDGSSPISGLIAGAKGNLYGTTSAGGSSTCNCGTVYKLTPGGNGSWTESVSYRFTGPPDGRFAYNSLVSDSKGTFYGTTVGGGTNDDGTVYHFTP